MDENEPKKALHYRVRPVNNIIKPLDLAPIEAVNAIFHFVK